MDAMDRVGIYWFVSCAGFLYFTFLATRRFIFEPSRMRFSVIAFATSWSILCLQLSLFRLDLIEDLNATSQNVEVIRAACCFSLTWMIFEFRKGKITTRESDVAKGILLEP